MYNDAPHGRRERAGLLRLLASRQPKRDAISRRRPSQMSRAGRGRPRR